MGRLGRLHPALRPAAHRRPLRPPLQPHPAAVRQLEPLHGHLPHRPLCPARAQLPHPPPVRHQGTCRRARPALCQLRGRSVPLPAFAPRQCQLQAAHEARHALPPRRRCLPAAALLSRVPHAQGCPRRRAARPEILPAHRFARLEFPPLEPPLHLHGRPLWQVPHRPYPLHCRQPARPLPARNECRRLRCWPQSAPQCRAYRGT